MPHINNAGVDLIKRFEGCVLHAYKDCAGVWTIGYGHTGGVRSGEVISLTEAEIMLRQDLDAFEKGVNKLLTHSINDNQFAALVSFSYNVGLGAFAGSTLRKFVNENKMEDAAEEFEKWGYAGGKKLEGLLRRREAEKELFIKHEPTNS